MLERHPYFADILAFHCLFSSAGAEEDNVAEAEPVVAEEPAPEPEPEPEPVLEFQGKDKRHCIVRRTWRLSALGFSPLARHSTYPSHPGGGRRRERLLSA